jgi:DnaJ-class molecular chaperone
VVAALLILLATATWLPVAHARDFYDLLNVPRQADEQLIKRAYRKLALKYHPDKVTGSDEEKADAARHFADINHAYETLSDPEKRRIYDQFGEEGLRQHAGQQGGGNGPGDIFSMFFGGRNPFGGGEPEEERIPKGHDVVVDLFVSLRDLYVGREVVATRDKPVLKPAEGKRPCKCRQKLVTRQIGPGMFQQMTHQECDECQAVKLERERDTLTVHVEPGMTEGQVCVELSSSILCIANLPTCCVLLLLIAGVACYCDDALASRLSSAIHKRTPTVAHSNTHTQSTHTSTHIDTHTPLHTQDITFFEEGEPIVDGEPGDLRFRIRTLPHATFRRSGADLLLNRTISLVDALTGFSHVLEHLDGHNVTLAAAGVTRPGHVAHVQGEGMPIFDSSRRGDLIVTYTVDFPAALTDAQKDSVRALFSGTAASAAAAS